MLRYYAIAALIVFAAGSALFAHRLAMQGWKLQPDARGAHPRAPGNRNEGFVTTPEPYFRGQGSWVLSALPACFDEQSRIEGPSLALAFHVPPAAERVPPGTTVRSGNCTVTVRAHDVWVARGEDRMRVPPEARLYRAKEGLTLLYEHDGRTEVRVYHGR